MKLFQLVDDLLGASHGKRRDQYLAAAGRGPVDGFGQFFLGRRECRRESGRHRWIPPTRSAIPASGINGSFKSGMSLRPRSPLKNRDRSAPFSIQRKESWAEPKIWPAS